MVPDANNPNSRIHAKLSGTRPPVGELAASNVGLSLTAKPIRLAWHSDIELEQAAAYLTLKEDLVELAINTSLFPSDNAAFLYQQEVRVARYQELRDEVRVVVADLDRIEATLHTLLSPEFGGRALSSEREMVAEILDKKLRPTLQQFLKITQQSCGLNLEILGFIESDEELFDEFNEEEVDEDDFEEPSDTLPGAGLTELRDTIADNLRELENLITTLTHVDEGESYFMDSLSVGAVLCDRLRGFPIPVRLEEQKWPIAIDKSHACATLGLCVALIQRIADEAVINTMNFLGANALEKPVLTNGFETTKLGQEMKQLATCFPCPNFSFEASTIEKQRQLRLLVDVAVPDCCAQQLMAAFRGEERCREAIVIHGLRTNISILFHHPSETPGKVQAEMCFSETRLAPSDFDEAPHSPPIEVSSSEAEPALPAPHRIFTIRPPGYNVTGLIGRIPNAAWYTDDARKVALMVGKAAHELAGRDRAFTHYSLTVANSGDNANWQTLIARGEAFVQLQGHALLEPYARAHAHPLNLELPGEDARSVSDRPSIDYHYRIHPERLLRRNLMTEVELLQHEKFYPQLVSLLKQVALLRFQVFQPALDGFPKDFEDRQLMTLMEGLNEAASTIKSELKLRRLFLVQFDVDSPRLSLERMEHAYGFYDSRGALVARGWFYGYSESSMDAPEFSWQFVSARQIDHARELLAKSLDKCPNANFFSRNALQAWLLDSKIRCCESILTRLTLSEDKQFPAGSPLALEVVIKFPEIFADPLLWVSEEHDILLIGRRGEDEP